MNQPSTFENFFEFFLFSSLKFLPFSPFLLNIFNPFHTSFFHFSLFMSYIRHFLHSALDSFFLFSVKFLLSLFLSCFLSLVNFFPSFIIPYLFLPYFYFLFRSLNISSWSKNIFHFSWLSLPLPRNSKLRACISLNSPSRLFASLFLGISPSIPPPP